MLQGKGKMKEFVTVFFVLLGLVAPFFVWYSLRKSCECPHWSYIYSKTKLYRKCKACGKYQIYDTLFAQEYIDCGELLEIEKEEEFGEHHD